MKWSEINVLTVSEFVEPIEMILLNNDISGWHIFKPEGFNLSKNNDRDKLIRDLVLKNQAFYDIEDAVVIRFFIQAGTKESEDFKTFSKEILELDQTSLEDDIFLSDLYGFDDDHDDEFDDDDDDDYSYDYGNQFDDDDYDNYDNYDYENDFDIINYTYKVIIIQSAVSDDNWRDAWKTYFKPIEIGKNIVIKPAWEVYDNPGKLIFQIEPGNVFGTGQHESTRMCIEALEQYIKPGDIIMDIGCGSGILAIIGLMLGAEYCAAVDHNPDVTKAVMQNASLNGISRDKLDIRIGDFFENPELLKPIEKACYKEASDAVCDKTAQMNTNKARKNIADYNSYDCIIANIVADAIIPLSPLIAEASCLKPDGLFIVSGIIIERLDEVLAALDGADFKIEEIKKLGEWACVVGRC